MKWSNTKPRFKSSLPCAILLLLVVGISNPSTANAAETHRQFILRLGEDGKNSLRSVAIVTFSFVAVPAGKFLLFRKGRDTCAVRFTSFRRMHDAKRRGFFRSDTERRYAEYDWYYQGDGSGDFNKTNILLGHSKLQALPTWGIGRMSFHFGQAAIECGNLKLHWHYPYWVPMHPGPKPSSLGYEFAPTAWDKICDIDIRHPLLKWYSYKEGRKTLLIPTSDLAGGNKTKK